MSSASRQLSLEAAALEIHRRAVVLMKGIIIGYHVNHKGWGLIEGSQSSYLDMYLHEENHWLDAQIISFCYFGSSSSD